VIVKTEEGRIKVISKGADSIIEKRLKKGQHHLATTKEFLDDFAKTGLRTLLVVQKEISQAEYDTWSEAYLQASVSRKKDEEMAKVADELETEFELLGSTAIEDKLQEDVGNTIYDIRQAGIKVWVLTGDKIETAMNIGYACRLLDETMNTFMLTSLEEKAVADEIAKASEEQKHTEQAGDNAVVVAGETLALIKKNKDLESSFVKLCENANVVLACRVSPKQKAEVVLMIKTRNPAKTTLAIGDGANDVNMITAAHIGIGISGFEGQQAVKASDYAIGKFKYLKNLLFVHGREAYRRNSFATVFIFYKNILGTSPIFFFGIWSIFSGSLIYHLTLYNGFNPFFTSLPIVWISTMDFEHPKAKLLSEPALYKYGIRNLLFNYKIFAREIFYGFGQALLISVFSLYAFSIGSQSVDGKYGGYTEAGDFIFICLVILVNTRVLVSSHTIDWGLIAVEVVSFLVYLLFAIVISWFFYFDDQYHSYQHIFQFPMTYFALFIFITVFSAIDRLITVIRRFRKRIALDRLNAEIAAKAAQENEVSRNLSRQNSVVPCKWTD